MSTKDLGNWLQNLNAAFQGAIERQNYQAALEARMPRTECGPASGDARNGIAVQIMDRRFPTRKVTATALRTAVFFSDAVDPLVLLYVADLLDLEDKAGCEIEARTEKAQL